MKSNIISLCDEKKKRSMKQVDENSGSITDTSTAATPMVGGTHARGLSEEDSVKLFSMNEFREFRLGLARSQIDNITDYASIVLGKKDPELFEIRRVKDTLLKNIEYLTGAIASDSPPTNEEIEFLDEVNTTILSEKARRMPS